MGIHSKFCAHHHALAGLEAQPKRKAYLSKWSIEGQGTKWAHLLGKVYGHPKLPDGEWITTSPILKLDIPGCSAETMNTVYMLEGKREPLAEFECLNCVRIQNELGPCRHCGGNTQRIGGRGE